MTRLPKNVRALLFDLDGVLVDTEPLHMKAWQQTLAVLKIKLTETEYQNELLGLRDRELAKKIFSLRKHHLTSALLEGLLRKKEEYAHKLLSKEIPVIPGALEFLENVHEKYPMALVTGALSSEAYFILDQMKWRKYFSIVITAQDVDHGKPDPEGYLKAYEKLKKLKDWEPPLEKKDCLIFEDSQFGIEAAKNAGIECVKITTSF